MSRRPGAEQLAELFASASLPFDDTDDAKASAARDFGRIAGFLRELSATPLNELYEDE